MLFEKIYGRIKTQILIEKSGTLQQKSLITNIGRELRSRQLLLDRLAHLEAIIDERDTSYQDMSAINQKLQTGRQEMQTARNLAIAIFGAVSQPLLVLDGNLRIITANRAFYRLFDVLPTEMEGQLFARLPNRQWQIPELHDQLNDLLIHNIQVQNFEVVCILAQCGFKKMFVDARQIPNLNNEQAFLKVDPDVRSAPQPSDETSPLAPHNVGRYPTPTILIQISELAGAQF